MQILTVCIFLTVPIVAVAALIISMLNAKKIKVLKRLTSEAISLSKVSPDEIQKIMLEGM